MMKSSKTSKKWREAEVVYKVVHGDANVRTKTWHNMILSLHPLAVAAGLRQPTIPFVQQELAKWDADYDGSPYVYFRSERKFILWELKYSTVNNLLDTAN